MVVTVDAAAEAEIRTASAWWRTNRGSAPDLFDTEIAAAFRTLASWPHAGIVARDTRLRGVRRLLVPRIGYHIHFRIEPKAVVVLSVWHTKRRRPRV